MSSIYTKRYEKAFEIDQNLISKVFSFENGIKLISRTYATDLLQSFSDTHTKGVYAVESNDQKPNHNRITIRFKCSHPNCKKKFRMWCERESISQDRSLPWIIESNGEECDHQNDIPRPFNVSGSRRQSLMKKLEKQSNASVRRELIKNDKIEDNQQGVTSKFKLKI